MRVREGEDERKEPTSNQRRTKLLADTVARLNRPGQLVAINVSVTEIDLVLGVKPSQKGKANNLFVISK